MQSIKVLASPATDIELLARYADLDICFIGNKFFPAIASAMMNGATDTRYADLCGPSCKQFLTKTGWRYTAPPACIAALDAKGAAVGLAWCGDVAEPNGNTGRNLSYAVAPLQEGKGLAKLLVATAFLHSSQQEVGSKRSFVNVQCRATNLSSARLATSFGMAPHADGDFSVPHLKKTYAFTAFRMETGDFRAAAIDSIASRGLHELLIALDACEFSDVTSLEGVNESVPSAC